MDSSRSGLLSTLLMTLPLIVVPAVALLRPPGQAGISTGQLDASQDEEFDSMFDDIEGFDADPSEAFGREQEDSSANGHKNAPKSKQPSTVDDDFFNDLDLPDDNRRESFSPRSAPSRTPPSDPFMDGDSGGDAPPFQPQGESHKSVLDTDTGTDAGFKDVEETKDSADLDKPDARQIVEQLNAMGALKTHWFAAGDKRPVGLAVFFRGDTDQTRIRFEAVGLSRDACAEDVLQQVTRWQQQNSQ